jgi:hypothetical protein
MKLKQFLILALILIITTYFIYNYIKKDLKKSEYDAEELKDDEDVFKNSVTPKKSIIEPKVVNQNSIENKEQKQKIFYRPNGKTVWYINEYNENEKLVKTTIYRYHDNDKTIFLIHEYNEKEKLVKTTFYEKDGKNIKQINEYNENEKLITEKFYEKDGKTIQAIREYNDDGTKK